MASRRHAKALSRTTACPRWILATLCFAVFLLSAVQTLVVPVVSDIGRSLNASAGATSWVITANLLAAAVSTPLLGRLGDLRGRRPVLLGILVAVLAGSLIAAAAAAFTALAFLHDHSWEIILATVAVFAAVVFGYAALPALLGEHVSRAETAIANSVNSVARGGSALASAVVVALFTRNYIPGLPVMLPRAHQYTVVFLIGTGTTVFSALLVAFGMTSPRRRPGGPGRRHRTSATGESRRRGRTCRRSAHSPAGGCRVAAAPGGAEDESAAVAPCR